MSWIDLHMHSDRSSDGEFSPRELLRRCAAAGVKVAAISDHNTVRGAAEAARIAAVSGVELIPAVELDATTKSGKNLHVLGYGIDLGDLAFARNEEAIREQEIAASGERIRLVREACGLLFDERKAYAMASDGCVTGEMIAEAALAEPKNAARLADYLPNGKRGDNPLVNFYWDFCSQGKLAYVPIEYVSLERAVSMIQNAGGAAVLAHPGSNTKEDEALLAEIFAQPLRGIEVFSSYHSREQIDFYFAWARRRGLLVTAGSDFHGKTKPAVALGKTGCDGCEAEILRRLRSCI